MVQYLYSKCLRIFLTLSPRVGEAHARKQLIFRTTLVDDRAVCSVAEQSAVNDAPGRMPVFIERENRHQRHPNITQPGIRVERAEATASDIPSVDPKVSVHVIAAAVCE